MASLHAVAQAIANPSINLQSQHPDVTPADALRKLSDSCHELGISAFDAYGDFHLDTDDQSSYLRRFESEIASEFGKEDAVFMPSGVMAQGIALLIHSGGTARSGRTFACHHSSHLLLHEEHSYRELIGMEPVIIDTKHRVADNGYSIPAMNVEDVQETFDTYASQQESGDNKNSNSLSTLIIELPHRELGGKCTSWVDLLKMRALCNERGIKFHCDGARIFEATCYYNDDVGLSEIAAVFDSVYISFYKGLGGLSGAMLLGSADFCDEARTWLRRFGGNLYTLLPYAVSGWAGYRRHWVNLEETMSFDEKYHKLLRLVAQISKEDFVSFDPEIPEVNMVHGYFRHHVDDVNTALDLVEQETGLRVLKRVGTVPKGEHAYQCGFRSRFEWTMGASNAAVPDSEFFRSWKALGSALTNS